MTGAERASGAARGAMDVHRTRPHALDQRTLSLDLDRHHPLAWAQQKDLFQVQLSFPRLFGRSHRHGRTSIRRSL